MKVLYTSAQIKQTISRLFSSSKGRRVAIVGFVGDGAQAYLQKPEGIELICWPKAGSTNPYALWELRGLGVKIHFSEMLHMKVYWTEDKGAVITSANLSTAALGAGGQKEFGVFLPSGNVNIDRVLDSIEYHPASDAQIEKLETAHKDYRKRNPSEHSKSRARTFARWYELSKPSWRLSSTTYTTVRLSSKAKSVLEEKHGSAKYTDILNTSDSNDYKENDWILCFNAGKGSGRPIEWMFAHHIVSIPRSDKKAYDPDFPYQIVQVFPLKTYDQPPFQIDEPFRKAFGVASRKLGGISNVVSGTSTRPSSKLLKLIYENYKQT